MSSNLFPPPWRSVVEELWWFGASSTSTVALLPHLNLFLSTDPIWCIAKALATETSPDGIGSSFRPSEATIFAFRHGGALYGTQGLSEIYTR